MKNLLIFASGTVTGGGSGFEKLVIGRDTGVLHANIVGVVSNHENGGVREKADRLKVPFFHSPKGRTADDYCRLFEKTKADFVALSGWLGFVCGLPTNRTFNIHPAWLPSPFGGKGMHGHHVHEAVIASYKRKEVTYSGVTMHFATPVYDHSDGIFFRRKVEILPTDDADSLGKRVNEMEHRWQTVITNRVVQGEISWDGVNPASMLGADIEI